MDLVSIAISFGAAFGVSAVATPMVSRMARSLRVIDRPSSRGAAERPDVPLLGGIAVALGFFVGLSIAVLLTADEVPYEGRLEALLLGSVLLLGLGAFDDRFGLGARTKLIFQLLAAGVAIFYGFEIESFRDPFTRSRIDLPIWVSWPATALWVMGVTNAMNLIDGLDGLATGVGAIIAATLTIVCWQAEQALGVYFGVAFVGALLGFLPFNFAPARIFLGDTGALFIGYALALLALEGYRKISLLTFLVPLLALAVPIMDTGLSVLRRLRHKQPIFSADRAHMHHRLLDAEGSHRSAVLSIYFLTACFCVIALSFTQLSGFAAIVFLIAVIVLTVRFLRNLGFFEDPSTAGVKRDSS